MSIFTDMLKEKDSEGTRKYSQARVYTLISVIFYFAVHFIMTIESYRNVEATDHINIEVLKLISDGLYSAMLLFCGYTFGSKFTELIKVIPNIKKDENPE